MKNIYIYSTLVALCASMTACNNFLDIEPVGAVTETTLTNVTNMDYAITGMYSSMHQTDYFAAPLTNYAYGDVMGGDANKGSTFNDQSDFTNLETYGITTDNGYLNSKWSSCYDGVFRANTVLSMAEKGKEEFSAKQGEVKDYYTETVAQARFFRGLWHFEAVKLFGAAVPYVGSEEYSQSVNPIVSNVDQSGNYIYIWDKIIDDFKYAYENLPDTWSSKQGYANKWAAAAFLAKVMMYESSPYNGTNGTVNRWDEVKSLLETIMTEGKDNHGTKFKLADTYESLYVAGESDWTGESVFDMQMAISGVEENTNNVNGSWHIGMSGALGTGGWGFYQPSYDLVNSYIVDDKGLPYTDNSYRNVPALTMLDATATVPTTDLTVYTDPRLDYAVGRFDVPYWDWAVPTSIDGWVRDVSNGGVYLNKKNIPKKADKGSLSVSTLTDSSAKNFHLIRYADVLLWYAEALIETGDYAGAQKYINMVRARAANSYVKAVNASTMEQTSSSYVLDDLINGKKDVNAAANYRVGLWPASQFTTKEGATIALRSERRAEMAMEGHRWYDLARWGVIKNTLTSYISYEQTYLKKYKSSVYNEKWVTMPIPNDQIITMDGALVQNVNWK
ncbi:MAG: RagB/SusD family nutrient uptake outer membrane protein [Parabacteroides sp.]